MPPLVDELRAEHLDLQHRAGRLLQAINEGWALSQPEAILEILVPLGILLRHHLEHEDRRFYPAARALEACLPITLKFEAGMLHLRETVDAYLSGYTTAASIQNDPTGFSDYTHSILRVLQRRIDLEEQELFPAFVGAGG